MAFTNTNVGIELHEIDAPPWSEVRALVAAGAKHTFDIVGATAMLLVALPVLAAVAVLVRLDGGPVLFRQRRLGRGGLSFPMLKFRSMAADAEDRLRSDPALYQRYLDNGFKLPADEDPRITRLCARIAVRTDAAFDATVTELNDRIHALMGAS